MVFLGLTVVGGLLGWIFFDRDPMKLMGILGALTGTATALEAAMVGKRATFKKEAADFTVTAEE
jgi:hypothetical protein